MLAALLKNFRKVHGNISQADAAAAAGISVDTWRAWEQGRYEPDFEQIGKLLRFLGSYGHPLLDRMGIKYRHGAHDPAPERAKTAHDILKPK